MNPTPLVLTAQIMNSDNTEFTYEFSIVCVHELYD